nr:supporter of activation of yellow protein-like isoform X1 [Solanum lycopersicum]
MSMIHTVNYVSRKICFCRDGFPKGYNGFLGDVTRLEEFIKDPWGLKAKQPATCQVKVPKLIVESPPRVPVGNGDGEEAASTASAQTKRVALQKKAAAAASNVGEDFTGGFQSGDVEGSTKDVGGEEQGLSNIKVLCRLCFSSETEGGERARKMMSCNCCGKKYHLSCLKTWGQHRDLFHWSSWTCPSCRVCEGCQTTGDPNKFMFCKRCDAAYHCYCMQPPLKKVSSGPYLCPKHTKCHSCCSNVPGNGLRARYVVWGHEQLVEILLDSSFALVFRIHLL